MYETLKDRVLDAKKQDKFLKLRGNEKKLVSCVYDHIIDGVETQRFRVPRNYTLSAQTEPIRVDLFRISFEKNLVYIDTIFRLSTHIDSLCCERGEVDGLVKIIYSAVEDIGLKIEKTEGYYLYPRFKIYYLIDAKEMT